MIDVKKLYATIDATVWAEAFMEAIAGAEVDVHLMIGWFANAMETARSRATTESDSAERERADDCAFDLAFTQERIHQALDELGTSGPDYPAPVANAVQLLRGLIS